MNYFLQVEIWKGPVSRGDHPPSFRLVPLLPGSTIDSKISEQIDELEKWTSYNVTVLCFTSPGINPNQDRINKIFVNV
jgi:hypothetical protein